MRTVFSAGCMAMAAAVSPAVAAAQQGGSDLAALPVQHGVSPPAVDLDAPPDLDLRGYRLSFEDRFERPDIVADGRRGRWFAPVHAPYGRAKFLAPGPDGPFAPGPRGLSIQATKWSDGGWRSGTMQTVDSRGRGFFQEYGYFEMRAKLPTGAATWPSFWLLTEDGYKRPSRTRGEIDVLEAYGSDVDRMHSSVHLWPSRRADGGLTLARHWYASARITVRGAQTGFHDYGVKVDPQTTTFYFDHHAVLTRPTLPEHRTAFYMVISLAMNPKGLDQTDSPQVLQVQRVRAYALPDGYRAAPADDLGSDKPPPPPLP